MNEFKMQDEHDKQDKEDQREMLKMGNAAVTIASHVNKYITKHCHIQMNQDPSASIFLEAMTVSYVVAMRSFSLYQSLDQTHRPTWDKFEKDAIAMVKTAFLQIKKQIDKLEDVCQFSKH